MVDIIVITPVKDALENTIKTAEAISASTLVVDHIIYNDYSSDETKSALEIHKGRIGYTLVHLEEITDTPSPNYKLVLQKAQQRSLKKKIPMVIVESDVEIKEDTLEKLLDFYKRSPNTGLVGAITVDHNGNVNFPYLKFQGVTQSEIKTSRSLSFCCTLFSTEFLKGYNFQELDDTKDWYDTTISQKSIALGFSNYVLMDVPVLHKPHGSRPWKMLKYSQPLKYYWKKFWQGKDKI